MKDFEQCLPLVVEKAEGSFLFTDKGPIIDAISSWWCKPLGHRHPSVIAAIHKQLDKFEHVIAANTTHEPLVLLGEKLTKIARKEHVLFASDGSSAVEISLKLALHAKQRKGQNNKNEFISLANSYHGETLGALSVSDLGIYKKPYAQLSLTCHFLNDIPYVSGETDPLWTDASDYWRQSLKKLELLKANVCAIIVEPIVQGAGGMRCYSADYLKRLSLWAHENDIYLIADEIMTGLGRTGTWLACQHADVNPDMICLSKGLTAGSLPLSCVLINEEIFDLFYDDYRKGTSFLHSHTHSANALAVCAALATLEVMEQENYCEKAKRLQRSLLENFNRVASLTGKLTNIRSVGAIIAGDLLPIEGRRMGFELYQNALENGALLRPIENTVYWLPPLNTRNETIVNLAQITLHSINTIYRDS